MRRSALSLAMSFALLLSAWGCLSTANTRSGSSSGTVSQMSLKKLDGGWTYLGDVVGKKVVMMSFWATWCKPCLQELKELGKIQAKLGRKKLQIIAVNTDPSASMGQVRPFVMRNGLKLLVLMDQDSRLLRQLNPKGNLPYYVIFDRGGNMVDAHQGYQPGDEVGIQKKLKKLLTAP